MTRVSRSIWLLVAAVAVIAGLNLGVLARRGPGGAPADGGAAAGPATSPVAGPGLVEPKSESIRIGAQVSGRLQRVLVEEGDRVTTGQVIAEIANDDYRARVASAEADLTAREADARRLRTGAWA